MAHIAIPIHERPVTVATEPRGPLLHLVTVTHMLTGREVRTTVGRVPPDPETLQRLAAIAEREV